MTTTIDSTQWAELLGKLDGLVDLVTACAFWSCASALSLGMIVGLQTWIIYLHSKKEKHPL